MSASHKNLAIRIGASVFVVALIIGVWETVRVAPVIIFGVVAAGLLILLALRIRASRKTKVIFGFYVVANEILLDGERSRYHFEIAEVIRSEERRVGKEC